MGRGEDIGLPIRYVVEPEPLGTGGAIKFAEPYLDGTTIVFNGDVLTEIDLAALVEHHRARRARATIVLAPGRRPGAVRPPWKRTTTATSRGSSRSPIRSRSRATRSTPASTSWSPTRSTGFRPTRGTRLNAGTSPPWSSAARRSRPMSNTGTGWTSGRRRPYRQAHRDILDTRCRTRGAMPAGAGESTVAGDASVAPTARLLAPCFVGPGLDRASRRRDRPPRGPRRRQRRRVGGQACATRSSGRSR